MKTSVSYLQELMMKRNNTVQFECVYQGGPPHQMLFKYQCTASGVSVIASGKSKQIAKQESARMCLEEMARRGLYTPPAVHSDPFAQTTSQHVPAPVNDSADGPQITSYVALLKEYCDEFKLVTPDYTLVSHTGPPHLPQFEISVSVGAHSRSAVANNKKVARQVAAQKLYLYLKESLSNVTQDFCEEDAMVRANQKAQEKYIEIKDEALPWRPNLGQKISEYHLGDEIHKTAMEMINNILPSDNMVEKVEEVMKALEWEYEWEKLQCYEKYKVIMVLHVPKSYPSIAITSQPDLEARAKQNTAKEMLEYLALML